MRKSFSLIFIILILLFPAVAQSKFSAEIDFGMKTTQIGQITKNSITVATGSTYLFTVDTPEDGGLVSTKPNIAQFLQQIVSKDGSVYEVYGESSFNGTYWKPFDGSKKRATSSVAGYKLSDFKDVAGELISNCRTANRPDTSKILFSRIWIRS